MAKSTAIKKAEKAESKRLQSLARARKKAKEVAQAQQHTIVAGGSAFAIGFAEKQGMALPTVPQVDPAVVYAGGTFVASMFVKDPTIKRVLEGITDGLLGVVAYKAARNGFNSLFSYAGPAAAATAGYGEDILETGEF